MALSDSSTSSPPLPQSSSRKESPAAITAKIAELGESRSELLGRIQGLKQDLQSWRSKLDTQVKVYRDELQELKKSLNNEVELLRTEFQDLRTTLQQQQDDVDASLRNLGLQDSSGDAEKIATPTIEEKSVVVVEENELSKENGTEADDMSSQCVERP